MPADQHAGTHEATHLESDAEIRRAILARRAAVKNRADGSSARPEAGSDLEPLPYRPRQRPPLALLTALDDGREDGERFRLGGDCCVIGRTDGDIRIPHDLLISGQHAEISRREVQGVIRWYLTDLESTNGTYVRVRDALLKHRQELLIGQSHFRFEAGQSLPAGDGPANPAPPRREATVGWQEQPVRTLVPVLVEVTRSGDGRRYPLHLAEYWIGRDPGAGGIVLADDPFASPRHARLYRDAKGFWHVENNHSRNGVWVRVEHLPLADTCQFQLGEQRFLLRVLA